MKIRESALFPALLSFLLLLRSLLTLTHTPSLSCADRQARATRQRDKKMMTIMTVTERARDRQSIGSEKREERQNCQRKAGSEDLAKTTTRVGSGSGGTNAGSATQSTGESDSSCCQSPAHTRMRRRAEGAGGNTSLLRLPACLTHT